MSLAHDLAVFPQTCMRNDRAAVLAQWGLDEGQALQVEARLGRATIESGESAEGAKRFATDSGRHGGTVSSAPTT